MNGTCIECQPQKVEGEDELYQFTFFTDISVNSETIDTVQTIHYNIKNTLTNMQRYLNRWKKYRSIWKVDKVTIYVWFVHSKTNISGSLPLMLSHPKVSNIGQYHYSRLFLEYYFFAQSWAFDYLQQLILYHYELSSG